MAFFQKKKRKTDEWLSGKFQPTMNEDGCFLLKLRWFSSQSGSCPAYVNIYIYIHISIYRYYVYWGFPKPCNSLQIEFTFMKGSLLTFNNPALSTVTVFRQGPIYIIFYVSLSTYAFIVSQYIMRPIYLNVKYMKYTYPPRMAPSIACPPVSSLST